MAETGFKATPANGIEPWSQERTRGEGSVKVSRCEHCDLLIFWETTYLVWRHMDAYRGTAELNPVNCNPLTVR